MILVATDDPGVRGDPKLWGMSGVWWFYVGLMCFAAALGLTALIVGAVDSKPAPFVSGLVICALSLADLITWVPFVRPLVLDDLGLRIPRVRGSRTVPWKDISGVGLIYRRFPGTRAPSGWYLQIWTTSDERIQIKRFVVTTLRQPPPPAGKRPFITSAFPPERLAHEDTDELGASHPGRAAKVIYDRTVMTQGNDGPLVTRASQKSMTSQGPGGPTSWAWWSPDGSMGRIAR